MKKRIYIEGSVLQNEATGIAKYVKCLYKEIEAYQPQIDVKIYNDGLPKLLLIVKSNKLNALYNLFFLHMVFPAILFFSRSGIVHLPWNGKGPTFIPKKHNIVSTIHDVLPCVIPGYISSERQFGTYQKRTQFCLRRSDIVMTDSKYSKESIREHFGYEASYVVPCASTLTLDGDVKLPDTIRTDYSYYVYVGGFDMRKGLDYLLEAHKLYASDTPNAAKLVMIGKVNYHSREFYEKYNAMIKSGLLLETGYVTDSELAALFLNAKALVYPSMYEGFGLPPIEAMGLGCPVLTTHQTSLKELCAGATLEIPDIVDTSDFSQRIQQIVHDEKLRNRLRTAGAVRAGQYSWKKSAVKFIKHLNTLHSNGYN